MKKKYEQDKTIVDSKTHFDVVIIGGGPAGLTAAIYASRANLKTLLIENGAPGGKIVRTSKIENWTGDITVEGPDLALRMFHHALAFGATYEYRGVKNVISHHEFNHDVILSDDSVIHAKAVIVATGMVERVPKDIENIEKFENRGVSYCAICDGPLFKGALVGVIGGGNSALEEAVYLSSIAKHVYIFIRQPSELWAEPALIKDAKGKANITIYLHSQIMSLEGQEGLTSIQAKVDNKNINLKISALFPYIGHIPVTSFVKDLGITNKAGFISTNEFMMSKVAGIYAIGDVREKEIRQIATAVGDGVIAGKIVANKINALASNTDERVKLNLKHSKPNLKSHEINSDSQSA